MKTEWVHKKLGDLGCSFSGLSGKTIDDFGEGKPFIPYMNIFTNGKIDPSKLEFVRIADNEHQNKVEKGDWFFTTSSETPEEVGMTSVLVDDIGEAYLNSFCFGFRLYNKEEIDPEFASYLFRSEELRKKISLFAQGSTRYNLPKQQMFEKLFISYPESLPAQRRIAAILASADKVIAATQKTIAKYKQIKQGMMEDLLNEQCTMNNVQWVQKTLIELADYHNGMAFKPSDWANDGVKIIRIEQLNNPLGKYDYYQGMFPETSAIHNGDLIFSWSATLKVVIWQWGDGVLNQHLFKVVPASNVDKHFLYYLLDYNMPKLGESSHGSTMKHIKRKELETHTVYIPRKIAEQKRIASILSSIDSKIECEQSVLNKYIQVKKGLMEKLLNEKCEIL